MEFRTAIREGVETLERHPQIGMAIAGVVLIDAALRGAPVLLRWGLSTTPTAGIDPETTLMAGVVTASVQVAIALLTLVAGPLVIGGLLGAIDATRRDRPIRAAMRPSVEAYLSLLAWVVTIAVIQFVIGLVASVVGSILMAAILVSGGSPSSPIDGGMIAFPLVAGIVGSLLGTIPVIVTQYYPAAVVLDDRSPIEALRSGWALLRDHSGVTLALDGVVVVPLTLAQIASLAVILIGTDLAAGAGPRPLVDVAPIAGVAVVGVIVWSIALPAHVALYRAIST
ncbi:MAG: hypothetical protein ACOCYZ_02035 [Halococcoides sp.]